MSSLQDPIRDGLTRGWNVVGGAHGVLPDRIVCDVAIIGSGAGAGITAELLTRAGLPVVTFRKRSAQEQQRLQPEGSRDLPLAAPGECRAQDRRQSHHHSVGSLRGRRHHRQLD
jgi:choline dehydrogenase-like flavoprotein